MFPVLDIFLEYWIEHVTFGLLYVMFTFPTRIFYRGVPGMQLVVIVVFGAVDQPLAACMLIVYFLEIYIKMVGLQVWHEGRHSFIVLHLFVHNNKLEKIQERSLRILQDIYELSNEELLNRNGSSTLLLHSIKLLLLEAYKSFHDSNADCLHNIFKFNYTCHERRPVKLIQPKTRTTPYGLRSFSYLGSQLWNDIVNSARGIANCDFDDLMDLLKHWECSRKNEGSHMYDIYYFECVIVLPLISLNFTFSYSLDHL